MDSIALMAGRIALVIGLIGAVFVVLLIVYPALTALFGPNCDIPWSPGYAGAEACYSDI